MAVVVPAAVVLAAPLAPAAAATPTWTTVQAPGPVPDSTGYHLDAIDCWSAGNCVAVGYRDAGGSSGSFIDQETDGTWAWVASTSQADLDAVSCPAAGACVAVGTSGAGGSYAQGVVEVQNGATWTSIDATGAGGRYPSYTGSLTGIDCPAVGSCAAVGQAQSSAEVSTGFVLTLEPGSDRTTPASWLAQQAPEPAADAPFEYAGLAGVSCTSAGNCRAVGSAHDDANFADAVPLVDQEKNYVWTYGGSPLPGGVAYGQLTSVSCVAGGTACLASGTNQDSKVPFVATIDTTTDSSAATGEALSAPFQFGELSATSCAPDGLCQAVGETYANSGSYYGYNGFVVSHRFGAPAGTAATTSSATAGPADANTVEHNETLEATSCVSGGFCVSVGSYLDSSGPQGQDEASVIDTRTYDSTGVVTGETDVKAPEPANDTADDDQNRLYGVTCVDGTHCTTVGSYFNETDRSRGVIDTLGGTTAPPPVTPPVPAPVVTRVAAAAGPASGGTSVTVTGANLGGASVVRFGTTAGAHLHVVSSSTLTVQAPQRGAGAVVFTATTSGGTSPATRADHYTYVAAPVVTRVSPSGGPVAGGTTVTLTGANFGGASVVRFGATAGSHLHVVSSTKLTVRAPKRGAGAADVRVTTVGGTSAVTRADRFTYVAVPVVTHVGPASGSHHGGTAVVVKGTHLSGATAVRFGGARATHVVVVSSTRLRVTVPAHARGTVDVRVTTRGGTSIGVRADHFRFR